MGDKVLLIVDDDLETLRLVGLMLERQGFKISAANSGLQAISVSRSEKPDLILLDVMMPDMDGYEVTRRLRQMPETASTPILMFTAKGQVEDKVTGYDAGVDDYLTKPVHPAELTAHIRALLSRGRTRSETPSERGYSVGIIAAKGGLCVSTVTLNLAISYAQKTRADVIAAELRPGQGSWGIELGQPVTDGLNNLVRLKPADITPARINDELVRMPFGIRLLFASSRPSDSQDMDITTQVETIVNHLPSLAQMVFLDIGSTYMPNYEKILSTCHETIVITEPFPSTTQRTKLLVDELLAKGYGKSKLMTIVLVNRVRADMQLSITQVQDILGYPVSQLIPPAPELSYQASARNIPMIQGQAGSMIAQQFNRLADLVAQHVAA